MTTILIGALIIGITIGMLGSGGSVISVPVLVYLVGHSAKVSIAESMAIVGLIAFFAAIPYARAKQIDWWNVWYFGIPGTVGTFFGAWLGGLASEVLQLLVFGTVLLLAAAMLLLRRQQSTRKQNSDNQIREVSTKRSAIWKIAGEGLVVGVVTGFVGVGGGFLIVPSLVVMGNLPIRLAIGTSLAIIVLKAAIGFMKYEHYLISLGLNVDLNTILIFTILGVVGSLIGRWLNEHLNQKILTRVFASFLILLGGFVILYEGGKLIG